MTNAQAAPAAPAAPTLSLVAAEATTQTSLERFQGSIQDLLETPLDAARVVEWTRLRAVSPVAGPAER